MNRIIFHIDVNNAFLSWTAIDLLKKGHKTDIREEYAIIGGDESKRRGIVLAKSPLAKEKGIVTAETLYSARTKCPGLKIFSPDYSLYSKMSKSLFNLLSKYTCDIEVASIDECFLDYGKIKKLYGDEMEFANTLKNRIKNELGFTVNIGIANNKLCAKMASDFSKPNKIHTLYDYEIENKMWPLHISKLYGIGKKTTDKLLNLNIKTIGDLAKSKKEDLFNTFKNQNENLIKLANGINEDEVISEVSNTKCMSNTMTLLYDYEDIEEINQELKKISNFLAKELRKENRYANIVAVIIKDKNFKTNTHQIKLSNGTNTKEEIYSISKKLFKESWNKVPVRLIGIRLDSLVSNNNYQISLFDNLEKREKDEKLTKIVDKLKEKFGDKIIK